MTWINREAEQELRRWAEHWLADDSQDIDELLDSMHVIDADDEAEAALERMGDYARTGWYTTHGNTDLANQEETGKAMNADLATIRARLRAARASHTPEELEDVILAVCWLAEERGLSRDPECRMALDRIGDFLRGLRPEPAAKPKETQG